MDSDEVKKELPEATQRFAKIDVAVRAVLKVGRLAVRLGGAHAWLAAAREAAAGQPSRAKQKMLRGARLLLHAQEFAQVRNCVGCCNKEGLLKLLETQQTELEMCEKVRAWGLLVDLGGAGGSSGGGEQVVCAYVEEAQSMAIGAAGGVWRSGPPCRCPGSQLLWCVCV